MFDPLNTFVQKSGWGLCKNLWNTESSIFENLHHTSEKLTYCFWIPQKSWGELMEKWLFLCSSDRWEADTVTWHVVNAVIVKTDNYFKCFSFNEQVNSLPKKPIASHWGQRDHHGRWVLPLESNKNSSQLTKKMERKIKI